jgi:hypothetical protein
MKFTTITAGLLAYSSIASALVSLSYEPTSDGRIRIGDSIRVKWSTDGTYVRDLLFPSYPSIDSVCLSFYTTLRHFSFFPVMRTQN